MILQELTPPTMTPVPVREFAAHLRLGTGFSDDGVEDPILEMYLRAATSAVESRIGKALITRSLKLVLQRWPHEAEYTFPISPVTEVSAMSVFSSAQGITAVSPSDFQLNTDLNASVLKPLNRTNFPAIPSDGYIEITFKAGFGLDINSIPPDLRHAILLIAAQSYEDRTAIEGTAFPSAALMLLEPFRRISL